MSSCSRFDRSHATRVDGGMETVATGGHGSPQGDSNRQPTLPPDLWPGGQIGSTDFGSGKRPGRRHGRLFATRGQKPRHRVFRLFRGSGDQSEPRKCLAGQHLLGKFGQCICPRCRGIFRLIGFRLLCRTDCFAHWTGLRAAESVLHTGGQSILRTIGHDHTRPCHQLKDGKMGAAEIQAGGHREKGFEKGFQFAWERAARGQGDFSFPDWFCNRNCPTSIVRLHARWFSTLLTGSQARAWPWRSNKAGRRPRSSGLPAATSRRGRRWIPGSRKAIGGAWPIHQAIGHPDGRATPAP